MRILLLGGGGREHALAWKLSRSTHVSRLYAAPGNPGIAKVAEIVPVELDDHLAIIAFALDAPVDLVIIGPEKPLVEGLADKLAVAGVRCFGPSEAAAQLEGSKGFTKDLAAAAGIPTGRYGRFTDMDEAIDYIHAQGAPIVVKADGLAAGKGVTVAATIDEAVAAVEACFSGSFGEAGAEVVIEEFLSGTEASLFALCDGDTAIPFGTAQDYKRAFDGDGGPNTGGMGAISPAPALTPDLVQRAMTEIVDRTMATMKARGTPFRGVLYAGLMITADGPKLIEFNVRFGDPECQVLMLRLDSDLVEILSAAAHGRLAHHSPVIWSHDTAVAVVMAARGYPGAYDRGTKIAGVDTASMMDGVEIFHAGTAMVDGHLVANGGRVLNIAARGADAAEARDRAYAAVAAIDWPEGYARTDIGAAIT